MLQVGEMFFYVNNNLLVMFLTFALKEKCAILAFRITTN